MKIEKFRKSGFHRRSNSRSSVKTVRLLRSGIDHSDHFVLTIRKYMNNTYKSIDEKCNIKPPYFINHKVMLLLSFFQSTKFLRIHIKIKMLEKLGATIATCNSQAIPNSKNANSQLGDSVFNGRHFLY